MNFSKVRKVKTPTRGTPESAGIDFFVPDEFEKRSLDPGCSINIPSGIKVNIPKGFCLIGHNKSGIALKNSFQIGACIIDSDYQGEIHLHVFNVGSHRMEINPGQKLVQYLLVPVLLDEVNEVPEKELYKESSERGEGRFGSTGLI